MYTSLSSIEPTPLFDIQRLFDVCEVWSTHNDFYRQLTEGIFGNWTADTAAQVSLDSAEPTFVASLSLRPRFLLRNGYCRSRRQINTHVQANKGGKKIDPKKTGLSGIKNEIVRANLMGVSEKMNKKGWTDSQGRKGKVWGVQALIRVAETHRLVEMQRVDAPCRASESTDMLASTVPT